MTTTTLFWTYAQLRAKVLADLDLEEETFISPDELLSYANEAIDRAEQLVHTIYEDYYLDHATLVIQNGVDEYPLPATIYAHKIRRIVYNYGSKVFKVKRLGDWKKFEQFEMDRVNGGHTDIFGYLMRNSTPGIPTIIMTPVPPQDGTCRVWFLRQANRLVNDADVLDIPEGHNFVLAFMKEKCIEKESHGEMTAGLQNAKANTMAESKLLVDTLTAMVPDAENNIEPDLSHYEEMS